MKSLEQLRKHIKGVFRENRTRLSEVFSKKGYKGLILLESNVARYRNADTEFPFRQESSFYWATGCDLDSSCFVIDFVSGKDCLFYKSPSSKDGIWHGRVKTADELCMEYDVDHARDIAELQSYMKDYLKENGGKIYSLQDGFLDLSTFPCERQDLLPNILSLRNVKTEKELMIMQFASDISSDAFKEVMKATQPNRTEYYLESVFRFHCGIYGAKSVAYEPIVGTGYNGACLHYHKNTETIQSGDLILMDAGSEVFCYATDITRTFPANGTFSEDQKLIYTMVLKAHYYGISLLKPEAQWNDILYKTYYYLTELLHEAGFIIGDDLELIKTKLVVKTFMPHGLGHYVGLDVHDGVIIPKEPLQKGNVVTIEPGIYFNESSLDDARKSDIAEFIHWDKVEHFRKFGGIRIEDTLVITESGSRSLTNVPKEIEDIEKLMENKNL